MYLKTPVKGTPLFTCVPMVDEDTGVVEWEPHRTLVYYWTVAGGHLFINDHHHSLYFEDYDDAFDFCFFLSKNQST